MKEAALLLVGIAAVLGFMAFVQVLGAICSFNDFGFLLFFPGVWGALFLVEKIFRDISERWKNLH